MSQPTQTEATGSEEIELDAINPDLQAAIRAADELTRLPDDWDGDGGKAVSRELVERVASFLRTTSAWAWRTLGYLLPPPRIQPGPGDSIDLHWQGSARELLVNVPAESSALSTFYGEVNGGEPRAEKVRGVLNLGHESHWLATWLSE